MLTIRPEQMDAFRRYMTERFERRVLEHIRRTFPTEFEKLGEEAALELIRTGIERAANYGLDTEYDAARFVVLMVARCPDFDSESPWVRELLTDESLLPRERLDAVCQRAEAEWGIAPEKWPPLG